MANGQKHKATEMDRERERHTDGTYRQTGQTYGTDIQDRQTDTWMDK